MQSRINKLISVIIVIVFLSNTVLWVAPGGAAENQLFSSPPPQNIMSAQDIYIPAQYGKVDGASDMRLATSGSKSPQVILIKDAHCYYEAQRNISKILDILISDYNIDLIGVEGATGKVDPRSIASAPDKKKRDEVADKYLKQGWLTAAEVLAIEKGKDYDFSIWGVEDLKLYLEDLQAFREVHNKSATGKRFTDLCSTMVSQLKAKVFSEEVSAYDDMVGQYRAGEYSFTEFIKYLHVNYEALFLNYSSPSYILRAIQLEDDINFELVEEERTRFLKGLENNLPQEELERFINNTLQFRMGKIPAVKFYTYIKQFFTVVERQKFIHLYRYIRLQQIYSKINRKKLFNEIDELIEDVYQEFLSDPIAAEVHAVSNYITILAKLAELKVVRNELKEYADDLLTPRDVVQFLKIQGIAKGINVPVEFNDDKFIEEVSSFYKNPEQFYDIALQRDQVLVDNLLNAMDKQKKNRAVLVAGGFHAEGMEKFLQEKGVQVVSVTPEITKEDPIAKKIYLNRMIDNEVDAEELLFKAGFSNLGPQVVTDANWQGISHRIGEMAGRIEGEAQGTLEQVAAATSADQLQERLASVQLTPVHREQVLAIVADLGVPEVERGLLLGALGISAETEPGQAGDDTAVADDESYADEGAEGPQAPGLSPLWNPVVRKVQYSSHTGQETVEMLANLETLIIGAGSFFLMSGLLKFALSINPFLIAAFAWGLPLALLVLTHVRSVYTVYGRRDSVKKLVLTSASLSDITEVIKLLGKVHVLYLPALVLLAYFPLISIYSAFMPAISFILFCVSLLITAYWHGKADKEVLVGLLEARYIEESVPDLKLSSIRKEIQLTKKKICKVMRQIDFNGFSYQRAKSFVDILEAKCNAVDNTGRLAFDIFFQLNNQLRSWLVDGPAGRARSNLFIGHLISSIGVSFNTSPVFSRDLYVEISRYDIEQCLLVGTDEDIEREMIKILRIDDPAFVQELEAKGVVYLPIVKWRRPRRLTKELRAAKTRLVNDTLELKVADLNIRQMVETVLNILEAKCDERDRSKELAFRKLEDLIIRVEAWRYDNPDPDRRLLMATFITTMKDVFADEIAAFADDQRESFERNLQAFLRWADRAHQRFLPDVAIMEGLDGVLRGAREDDEDGSSSGGAAGKLFYKGELQKDGVHVRIIRAADGRYAEFFIQDKNTGEYQVLYQAKIIPGKSRDVSLGAEIADIINPNELASDILTEPATLEKQRQLLQMFLPLIIDRAKEVSLVVVEDRLVDGVKKDFAFASGKTIYISQSTLEKPVILLHEVLHSVFERYSELVPVVDMPDGSKQRLNVHTWTRGVGEDISDAFMSRRLGLYSGESVYVFISGINGALKALGKRLLTVEEEALIRWNYQQGLRDVAALYGLQDFFLGPQVNKSAVTLKSRTVEGDTTVKVVSRIRDKIIEGILGLKEDDFFVREEIVQLLDRLVYLCPDDLADIKPALVRIVELWSKMELFRQKNPNCSQQKLIGNFFMQVYSVFPAELQKIHILEYVQFLQMQSRVMQGSLSETSGGARGKFDGGEVIKDGVVADENEEEGMVVFRKDGRVVGRRKIQSEDIKGQTILNTVVDVWLQADRREGAQDVPEDLRFIFGDIFRFLGDEEFRLVYLEGEDEFAFARESGGRSVIYLTTAANDPLTLFHEVMHCYFQRNRHLFPKGLNEHTFLRGAGEGLRQGTREPTVEEAALISWNESQGRTGPQALYGLQDFFLGPENNVLPSRQVQERREQSSYMQSVADMVERLPGMILTKLADLGMTPAEQQNIRDLMDWIERRYARMVLVTDHYHNHAHTLAVTYAHLLALEGAARDGSLTRDDIKVSCLAALLHDFHIRDKYESDGEGGTRGTKASVAETIRQVADVLGIAGFGRPAEARYVASLGDKDPFRDNVMSFLGVSDEAALKLKFLEIVTLVRRTDFPSDTGPAPDGFNDGLMKLRKRSSDYAAAGRGNMRTAGELVLAQAKEVEESVTDEDHRASVDREIGIEASYYRAMRRVSPSRRQAIDRMAFMLEQADQIGSYSLYSPQAAGEVVAGLRKEVPVATVPGTWPFFFEAIYKRAIKAQGQGDKGYAADPFYSVQYLPLDYRHNFGAITLNFFRKQSCIPQKRGTARITRLAERTAELLDQLYLRFEITEGDRQGLEAALSNLRDGEQTQELQRLLLRLFLEDDQQIGNREVSRLWLNIRGVMEVFDTFVERIDSVSDRTPGWSYTEANTAAAVQRVAMYLTIIQTRATNLEQQLPVCMQRLAEIIDTANPAVTRNRINSILHDLLGKELPVADIYLRQLVELGGQVAGLDDAIVEVRNYLEMRGRVAGVIEDTVSRDSSRGSRFQKLASGIGRVFTERGDNMVLDVFTRVAMGENSIDSPLGQALLVRVGDEDQVKRLLTRIERLIRSKGVVGDDMDSDTASADPGVGGVNSAFSGLRGYVAATYSGPVNLANTDCLSAGDVVLVQPLSYYVDNGQVTELHRVNFDSRIAALINSLAKGTNAFTYKTAAELEAFRRLLAARGINDISSLLFVDVSTCSQSAEIETAVLAGLGEQAKDKTLVTAVEDSIQVSSTGGNHKLIGGRVAGEEAASYGTPDLFLLWNIQLWYAQRGITRTELLEKDSAYLQQLHEFLRAYYGRGNDQMAAAAVLNIINNAGQGLRIVLPVPAPIVSEYLRAMDIAFELLGSSA